MAADLGGNPGGMPAERGTQGQTNDNMAGSRADQRVVVSTISTEAVTPSNEIKHLGLQSLKEDAPS